MTNFPENIIQQLIVKFYIRNNNVNQDNPEPLYASQRLKHYCNTKNKDTSYNNAEISSHARARLFKPSGTKRAPQFVGGGGNKRERKWKQN